MAQKKGQTGNPNGRPKGSQNKVPARTRELLSKFVEDKFEDVIKAFDSLEDKDKVTAYTSILKYVLPPARDEKADEDRNTIISDVVERLFNREKQN